MLNMYYKKNKNKKQETFFSVIGGKFELGMTFWFKKYLLFLCRKDNSSLARLLFSHLKQPYSCKSVNRCCFENTQCFHGQLSFPLWLVPELHSIWLGSIFPLLSLSPVGRICLFPSCKNAKLIRIPDRPLPADRHRQIYGNHNW